MLEKNDYLTEPFIQQKLQDNWFPLPFNSHRMIKQKITYEL